MLAFMAYPATRNRGTTGAFSTEPNNTSQSQRHNNLCSDSVSSASMNERAPQSFLSLSTEASSAIWDDNPDVLLRKRPPVDSQKDEPKNYNSANPETPTGKKFKDTTAMYIERIYENTVHGPCQTVTMCEVEHLDLFMNCQQPLSFLGFGHHPMDPTTSSSFHDDLHDTHNFREEEEMPLPGAYDVPKGCEYCGAAHTRDCVTGKCRRPKLFFQKKRPPFAPRDDTKWEPQTDLVIRSGMTPKKQPSPHTHRNT